MKKLQGISRHGCWLLGALLLLPATGGAETAEITVSVTVVVMPCHVNGDRPVDVEFNTIEIDQLSRAKAQVPLAITCDSDPAGTLQYGVRGTAAGFDPDALATDVSGLGIRLFTPAGAPITPNTTWTSVDKNTQVQLDATLVSDNTITLSGGEFRATATLVLQML